MKAVHLNVKGASLCYAEAQDSDMTNVVNDVTCTTCRNKIFTELLRRGRDDDALDLAHVWAEETLKNGVATSD